LNNLPILLRRDRTPFATGSAFYVDADSAHPHLDPRILVRLSLGLLPRPLLAVVDTAAHWCLFEPEVGFVLRQIFRPIEIRVSLSTRLGSIYGDLYRIPIVLVADDGQDLDVEATVLLSPDWRGPNFIGYQGLLQRIRFAVDPETNLFYFGQI
jgi:hypothetical protein